jgi:hypothetical protein
MKEKKTLLTVLDPRGQPSGVFGYENGDVILDQGIGLQK